MAVFNLTRPELGQLIERLAAASAEEAGTASFQGEVAVRKNDAGVEPPQPDFSALRQSPDVRRLARLIDHTMLRAEASRAEVEEFCRDAAALGVGAACVHPAWVSLAARRLRGSGVKVCSVAGFPFGATLPSAKRAEAAAAIRAGAEEIDMVMNIGALRSGDLECVEADIHGVVEVARASGCVIKVILENAYLSDNQKVTACRIAQQAGVDFVKTSTGFGPSGAKEADVRLMRETVGSVLGVKAAGGIRTLQDALRMLAAGADRLGASQSVSILAEAARRVG